MGSTSEDYKDLDIYYNINLTNHPENLPEDFHVSDVKINIYKEDTSQKVESITGEQDAEGGFKIGSNLHVIWEDARNGVSFRDAGFYRVELEVEFGERVFKTNIADGNPSIPGWQCPDDGYFIADLAWRHRPKLYIHRDETGFPTTVSEFVENSSRVTTIEIGSGTTDANLNYYDLFSDNEATTDADISDLPQNQQEVYASNHSAIYYTSNRDSSSNYIFLQNFMFMNFSGSPFIVVSPGGQIEIYHEGDVEYAQVTVRKHDPDNPSDKTKWLNPYAATASQHYYAQTLKWDMMDGSKVAGYSSDMDRVEHDDNGRLALYISLNGHATYFAEDSTIATGDEVLGTQVMYDSPPFLLWDSTGPARAKEYQYISLDAPESSEFRTWGGRWGYMDTLSPSAKSNGPPGIPNRTAASDNGRVNLLSSPLNLHNLSLKSDQSSLEIE